MEGYDFLHLERFLRDSADTVLVELNPDGDVADANRAFADHAGLAIAAIIGRRLTHAFLTAWESQEAFRSYMKSREHAISHGREPGDIMARTGVRHEAYEVLMDSRCEPEVL